MDEQIEKIRKTHSKKTEWGTKDNFAKAAKKAIKRRQTDEDDDWREEIRNATLIND